MFTRQEKVDIFKNLFFHIAIGAILCVTLKIALGCIVAGALNLYGFCAVILLSISALWLWIFISKRSEKQMSGIMDGVHERHGMETE